MSGNNLLRRLSLWFDRMILRVFNVPIEPTRTLGKRVPLRSATRTIAVNPIHKAKPREPKSMFLTLSKADKERLEAAKQKRARRAERRVHEAAVTREGMRTQKENVWKR